MAEIWRNVKGTDIFPRGALDGPWAFLQKRAAVHANSGLRAIIEAGVDFENLEDSTIPLEVVTTSLTDGRERWITHGPAAVEAILASSAIPSIFPPVVIDGDVLVDGGVVTLPINRAIAAGATADLRAAVRPAPPPPAPTQAPRRAAAHRLLRGHPRPLRAELLPARLPA